MSKLMLKLRKTSNKKQYSPSCHPPFPDPSPEPDPEISQDPEPLPLPEAIPEPLPEQFPLPDPDISQSPLPDPLPLPESSPDQLQSKPLPLPVLLAGKGAPVGATLEGTSPSEDEELEEES